MEEDVTKSWKIRIKQNECLTIVHSFSTTSLPSDSFMYLDVSITLKAMNSKQFNIEVIPCKIKFVEIDGKQT